MDLDIINSTRYTVLKKVAELERTTWSEVDDKLAIPKSNIHKSSNKLFEENLIEKNESSIVLITEKGKYATKLLERLKHIEDESSFSKQNAQKEDKA